MKDQDINKLLKLPLAELMALADGIRRRTTGDTLELCGIMNAKSGLCGEDCKFCAQSSCHSTSAEAYPLKRTEEILERASRARDIGAGRFGIVTSGNALMKEDLEAIARAITRIKKEIDIEICASLGELSREDLAFLKRAGLSRYHHNIETSPGFFPKIVSTHSFRDRVRTIKAAKEAGLKVCAGGIIGMGETWSDRIDMALALKELDADSVPLNILIPVKGTGLEGIKVVSCADVIRTIAIFRIILEDKIIRLAAGRESALKDFQAMAFMAGASAMMIGGYLTVKGRAPEEDLRLVKEVKELWAR
ncbi:MAG: biotin synthase BioB [Candidatus Omnitrophica bacterium]|nr:biotin synthase BioB [Candidatus Omnitrophota bacterium]